MNTPTPNEISELQRRLHEAHESASRLRDTISKLERERDEARVMLNRANEQHIEETLLTNKYAKENDELKEQLKRNILDSFPVTEERVKWERLIQERDQLRKVADELAKYRAECNNRNGVGVTDDISIYFQLPHVIERNKQ